MAKKSRQVDGSQVKPVAEIKRTYEQKREYVIQARAALEDKIVQLANLTREPSERYTVFDKAKLRTFLKNPLRYQSDLRELSQFLYRMSHQYRRIIHYYAEMIDLTAYSVIPIKEFGDKKDNKQKYLKRFNATVKRIRKMNMASQIMKCLIIAWREDVFYGYTYEDSDAFFIMPLNGKYCRISSQNYDGSLNFAFDFSYFNAYPDDLEYWDDEFRRKYEIYLSDRRNMRWQELDRERTMCLKVNIDNIGLVIPPFVQLFPQIIDLIDYQELQAVKDELSIYKLIVARLDTLDGTDEPDDFKVDVDTALAYFKKLEATLPDEVAATISPLPLDVIEFKGDTTESVDMISNSMSNLFKAAGVSQILDSDKISGTEAFRAAIMADSLQALKILLPQIEVWHNHYLQNHLPNACPIKYIQVTPYTKQLVIDQYKDAAQYGLPVKLAYASLLGFDPLEANSLTYLEEDCLGLSEHWKPLQSSHTQSGTQRTAETEKVSEPDATDEKEENKDG